MPGVIGVEDRTDVSGVRAPGTGRIAVERQGSRSIVTRAIATSPLRILTPRNHGTAAWAYAATYGGGLVDGDHVRVEMSVGREATAMLSTQAATKVYRSPRGTSTTLVASVSSGGLLALLPDPVVLFAQSRYRQSQRVDLDGGANLVLVDWLSCGRRATGERWQFDLYESRLEVWQRGRLAVLDALSLNQEEGDLATRLGRFNILCLVVLVGPAVAPHAQDALARVQSLPVIRDATLLLGASPVAGDGCLIRIAGISFEEVAAAAHEYARFVPSLLGDDPWARKW